MTLQSKLHDVTLPVFSGDAKIKYLGNAHYEFHRWGSEVTGQGPGGPERKGGRAPGLARDISGADGGMVPRRIKRKFWEELGPLHSFIQQILMKTR